MKKGRKDPKIVMRGFWLKISASEISNRKKTPNFTKTQSLKQHSHF